MAARGSPRTRACGQAWWTPRSRSSPARKPRPGCCGCGATGSAGQCFCPATPDRQTRALAAARGCGDGPLGRRPPTWPSEPPVPPGRWQPSPPARSTAAKTFGAARRARRQRQPPRGIARRTGERRRRGWRPCGRDVGSRRTRWTTGLPDPATADALRMATGRTCSSKSSAARPRGGRGSGGGAKGCPSGSTSHS